MRRISALLLALTSASALVVPRNKALAPRNKALAPRRTLAPPRRLAPVAALPGVAAATLPTCLGFWKGGYAVSYGYGGAMAAAGALALQAGAAGVGAAHAAALLFYGARLNLFLLYRELFLPVSIHQMKPRPASLAQRLKRAPVVIGCSLLYYCMAAPLKLTAGCVEPTGGVGAAVAVAWFGFALGAVGDVYKSAAKAVRGADALVTGGPFALLRHPNYTGEMIGWAGSAAAGVLAVSGALRANAVWTAVSLAGLVGIFNVLAGEATAGLERKQRAKYGASPEYQAWVRRTWAGPSFGAPPAPVDKFERVAWSGTCYPSRA